MNFKILLAKTFRIRMLKKIICSAIFALFVCCSIAQKGVTYFIYKVKKGESFRSIASKYNLSGQKLAGYNNLDFYEGKLAAKTLRIPKKFIYTDSVTKVKATPKNTSNKFSAQEPPLTSGAVDTLAISPVPPAADTQASTPPIIISDTATQEANVKEQPTLQSDVSKHLPLIIFLSVSLLLLAGAIVYYKWVNRN